MNRTPFLPGALMIPLLLLILAMDYALPGFSHVLVSGSHPPINSQPTHVILFEVLTVLGVIIVLLNRTSVRRSWYGGKTAYAIDHL